jgi:hypothetical protein
MTFVAAAPWSRETERSMRSGDLRTLVYRQRFRFRVASMACFIAANLMVGLPIAVNGATKNMPKHRELGHSNLFALNVKAGISKSELKLKALELLSREAVSSEITKTSWRVDISGRHDQALNMFEGLRQSSRSCAMTSIRFSRAAVNLRDFEVFSNWQCYE